MPKFKPRAPRYATKEDVVAAGADAVAWDYARASKDESGEEKSVGSQHRENDENADRYGWVVGQRFDDDDLSGEDPDRAGYLALMDEITRRPPDVLVLRMSSRPARDVEIYGRIRNHCLKHGVVYWLVGKTLYDLRDLNDALMLDFNAVMDNHFLRQLKDSTLRGHRDSAIKGKPGPGICPFGYRRIYHPRTGDMLTQEPDDATPDWAVEPGPWRAEVPWTPADIVEWVFAEAHGGRPLLDIAAELDRRRVPNPRTFNALQKGFAPQWRSGPKAGQAYGSHWNASAVRNLLLNPAYLGHRRHNEAIKTRDCWQELVDPAVFHEVGEDLRSPKRLTFKGPRTEHHMAAKHHLTRIASCGKQVGDGALCDLGLRAEAGHYRCRRGHAAAPLQDVDHYVIALVLTKLADPALQASLKALDGNDDELRAIRAGLAELRSEAAEWDDLARRGIAKAAVYGQRITDLRTSIEAAEAEERKLTGLPAHVRDAAGPHAAQHWHGLGLVARRKLLASVIEVRLLPAGRGRRTDVSERLSIRWLLGG